ncbi:MAG: hypothetical protein R6V30_01070, partial [Paracoccaceae bacterium]
MRKGAPVVHVARDDKRLAAMQAALRFFAPDVPVFTFPAWDCLPYDRVSPNPDISAQRLDYNYDLFYACSSFIASPRQLTKIN